MSSTAKNHAGSQGGSSSDGSPLRSDQSGGGHGSSLGEVLRSPRPLTDEEAARLGRLVDRWFETTPELPYDSSNHARIRLWVTDFIYPWDEG